mgnify:FL=1
MKRIHIHIAVNELSKSIGFYSAIFAAQPTIERKDYAKWHLNDPIVNFAISLKGSDCGMNHMGIQVDSESELQEISQRLENAEINYSSQVGTSCCHSHSNKHWALDPQGIAWESFHTLNDSPVFASELDVDQEQSSTCCIPLKIAQSSKQNKACCAPNEHDATACCP